MSGKVREIPGMTIMKAKIELCVIRQIFEVKQNIEKIERTLFLAAEAQVLGVLNRFMNGQIIVVL